MSSTPSAVRRFLWPALLLVLIAAFAIGTWPRSEGAESNEARTARISADIRCPTCAGLSVAESEAPLAQSARSEIAAQVAAGQPDEVIRAYFVDRYGNTALMSPPKQGIAAWAWFAPVILGVLALVGMVFAVRKWRRRGRLGLTASDDDETLVAGAMQSPVTAPGPLAEELAFLIESLQRLESEFRMGAVSEDEHNSLHAEQVTRAAAIIRAIHAPASSTPRKKSHRFDFKGSKRNQRLAWGGVGISFLVVAMVALAMGTDDRLSRDSATGAIAGDTNSLLARAGEQTAKGKPADAIKTYDQVLRLDATNAQALAYRGWLIRLAGLSAQGEQSIDSAIAAHPNYPDARFFKGFILLRDKDDPAGAITHFDAFLANNPPQEMVSLVQQARADAVAQLSDPTVTTTTVRS